MDSKKSNKVRNSKIVFIVGTLECGGIERCVTEWCLYLKAKTEWQPSVICILERRGPFLKILSDNSIEVFECKLKNTTPIPFIFRLGSLLRKINPHVVHSQVAFSLLWQCMAIIMGGAKRIVFTQHNEYQNWNTFSAKLRLRSYYILSKPFIHAYTCVSKKVKQNLTTLLNEKPEQFSVIYNSVNTELFYPRAELRMVARKQMGIKDSEFAIGMVANFSRQKGHTYILEACAALQKENFFNYRLILIGNGDYSEFIKQAEQLDIIHNVNFLGKRNDVDILLQGLDCFVLPSLWEGLPLALIEAMACQLPVIASEVSGNTEVIEHKTNGLLFPVRNANALKEGITEIKKNPEMAKKLALSAHKTVIEKFHLPTAINKYIALYY